MWSFHEILILDWISLEQRWDLVDVDLKGRTESNVSDSHSTRVVATATIRLSSTTPIFAMLFGRTSVNTAFEDPADPASMQGSTTSGL